MNNAFLRILWGLLAVGAVIFGVLAQPALTSVVPGADGAQTTALAPDFWIIPVAGIIAVITVLTLFTARRPIFLRQPLAWLRERPVLYWLFVLVFLYISIGGWISDPNYQPTNGRPLRPIEFCYLCVIGWLFLFLLAYDLNTPQLRAMGVRLGKSRLSGVMVMLTTLLLLFFAAEFYLRIFYITTDGYGFTAMNYWWYQNFYKGGFNSLGFRDHEPLPDDTGKTLTRLAIVGDSFAVGHGINNIDDSFPQLLEQRLGPGYDVNLVAQSGWDSDVEAAQLDAYYQKLAPRLPGYVVLSYYLNDIDYLLQYDPARNPDAVFTFPENPSLAWTVLNFFTPNFVYYNLLQFTSPTRRENFTARLIEAHLDDAVWNQHTPNLDKIAAWTRDHDAQLIVLLWPQLAAVDESQPALQRVSDYFSAQGAQIVDMSAVLRDKNPLEMIVNRFDAHPGIPAQRLAAEQLYHTLRSNP